MAVILGRLTVAAVLVIGTAEITLRIAYRHNEIYRHNDLLRALLYEAGDGRRFDDIGTLEDLLRASPFPPVPFMSWCGFKANSRGFRTHEYERAKSPGTYRVVALGDSFTFDSGMVPLDRMWHTLVGERLRSRLDRPVEVINLGVSGVGPRFTARLFEIEGAALAPDLVLLGFFVGNDLTDEEPELRYRSMPERWSLLWRLIVRAPIVVRSHRRIAEAREHAQDTARRRRLPTGPGGVPIPGYVYDRDTNTFGAPDDLLRIESGRARIFATSWRPAVAARLDDVTATVATLDRAVRAAGGRLVVVVIPDVVQVDLAVREAAAGGADPAAYDFDWLQPALLARLGAAAVAAVDVLPALRAAPTSPRLYRIHDTHWSDVGNAVAAAEIVAYLEAHLPELAPHLHRALRPGRAR